MQTLLLTTDEKVLRADMSDRERTELLRLAAIINSKLDRNIIEDKRATTPSTSTK